jgi:hypothetical protein
MACLSTGSDSGRQDALQHDINERKIAVAVEQNQTKRFVYGRSMLA